MKALVAGALLVGSIAFAQNTPAPAETKSGGQAAGRFDGNWLTTVTCPAKGNTQGYKLKLPSTIKESNFRGEYGTAGTPGYLLVEGKIGHNGAAKLAANGLVASRQYAVGIFTGKGDDYSYDVKAQFEETHGTGAKGKGLVQGQA